jgi:hypothetical protein
MLLPVIDWKELMEKKGARIALVCIAAVASLGGVAVGGYYLWPGPTPKPPPPVASSTMGQTIDYAASTDFERLPMNQRLAWIDGQAKKLAQMDDDDFARTWRETDEATRDKIANNLRTVMRERTRRDVDQFFTLPKEQREAFLDKRLDEMKQWDPKMHKLFGGRRPGAMRGAAAAGSQPTDEFKQRERRANNARFLSDTYNFMNNESADRRNMTFKYFSEIGRRRVERGDAHFPGRSGAGRGPGAGQSQ